MTEAVTTYERGWMVRARLPKRMPPERVFVWLHGWTGDEKSMEIFSRGIPETCINIFPRAPIKATPKGYGWIGSRAGISSPLTEYQIVAASLMKEIDLRLRDYGSISPSLTITGFSQGAAMAYAMLLYHPHRIERAAAIAGFIPIIPQAFDTTPLQSIPVYIAHGTRDDTIPIESARNAASYLQTAGANVSYCENSGGHILPASCYTQLTQFLLDG